MTKLATEIGSAAEFRRMIEQLWGYGAQTRAARHWEVSDRTVRHWVAGKRAVPEKVMEQLRAMTSIAPPPDTTSDDDRDDACRAALEPSLTNLRNRAVGAGWHPAEVAAAILSMTIDEIRDGAGDDAVREVLEGALDHLTSAAK